MDRCCHLPAKESRSWAARRVLTPSSDALLTERLPLCTMNLPEPFVVCPNSWSSRRVMYVSLSTITA